MDLRLSGKTVLITGASGGIGRAIALGFADENANVVLHYHRNETSARQLVEAIGNERAITVQADLSDEFQVASAFEGAVNQFGSIDVLVANAGVWPPDPVPILEMSLEQWQSTIGTNLTSVFLCARQFLRHVSSVRTVDPAMVLIGSTAAIYGEAGHGDYAASKSGLAYGLMLSLKNEIARLSRGGRVNTVCPGWTVTPMAEKFTNDGPSLKRALSTITMRKVADPVDIASAVLFLASGKAAGHITGQVLTVSGGMEGRKLYEDSELDVNQALP